MFILSNIEELTSKVRDQQGFKKYFKKFKKQYQVNFKHSNFDSIRRRIATINETNLAGKHEKNKQNNSFRFKDEELKIFIEILTLICYNNNVSLEEMKEEHYDELQRILPSASLTYLKYQVLCLIQKKNQLLHSIYGEEEQLLERIIKENQEKVTKKSWKEISYQLFLRSQQKIFRSSNSIKKKYQRDNSKEKWTCEEDLRLLKAVLEENIINNFHKVAAEIFGEAKTEKMVQSRFKYIMKKAQKGVSSSKVRNRKGIIEREIKKLQLKIQKNKQKNIRYQMNDESPSGQSELRQELSCLEIQSSASYHFEDSQMKEVSSSQSEESIECQFERCQRTEKMMLLSEYPMFMTEGSPFFMKFEDCKSKLTGFVFIEEPVSLW